MTWREEAGVDAERDHTPALVMDRDWNIRPTNEVATLVFGFLMAGHNPGPARTGAQRSDIDGWRYRFEVIY